MFSETISVTGRAKFGTSRYSGEYALSIEISRGYHISQHLNRACIVSMGSEPNLLLAMSRVGFASWTISQFRTTNTVPHRKMKSAELDHPGHTRKGPRHNIITGEFHTEYGIARSRGCDGSISGGKTLARQYFIHISSYNTIVRYQTVEYWGQWKIGSETGSTPLGAQ